MESTNNQSASKKKTNRKRNRGRKPQQQQQQLPPQQQEAKVNLSRQEAGSNWVNALKVSANLSKSSSNLTVEKNELNNDSHVNSNNNLTPQQSAVTPKKKSKARRKTAVKYVAIDCEMVGIGPCGTDDMLARVSIVNRNGEVLLDKYVKPREKVTNYRTSISGIRPNDIENGEDFDKVQDEVVELLKDKILVGHAIKHDLKVLFIKHPYTLIRDTSNYRPLAKLVSNGATPSLKRVAKVVLGIDIQSGEHSSVEDARAAMQVYNRLSVEWEKYIQKKAVQNQTGRYYRHA